MHTDSFMVYVKTEDINNDIAEDVEIRFDTLKFWNRQAITWRRKQKNNWINERRISWRNHEKTYKITYIAMMKIKKQKAQKSVS